MPEIPEDIRRLIERKIKEDPSLLEEYGNPLDPNNPQFWTSTERIERKVSLEDQVRYLGKDVEALTRTVARLLQWKFSEQDRRMKERIEEAKKDPQKALELLKEMTNFQDRFPERIGAVDASGNLVGSTKEVAGNEEIDTPNGRIKVRDIPGFSSDPNWKPSDEWLDQNCMCQTHQEFRKKNQQPDSDFRPGLYI